MTPHAIHLFPPSFHSFLSRVSKPVIQVELEFTGAGTHLYYIPWKLGTQTETYREYTESLTVVKHYVLTIPVCAVCSGVARLISVDYRHLKFDPGTSLPTVFPSLQSASASGRSHDPAQCHHLDRKPPFRKSLLQLVDAIRMTPPLHSQTPARFVGRMGGGAASLALVHWFVKRFHITLVSRTVTVVILGRTKWKKSGGRNQNWAEIAQSSTGDFFVSEQSICIHAQDLGLGLWWKGVRVIMIDSCQKISNVKLETHAKYIRM